MADYVPKLGELARPEDQRDAIHVAVVPVKHSRWGPRVPFSCAC